MKYLMGFVIFLVSLIFFMFLEYGRFTILINELLTPLIFSSAVSGIFINEKLKKFVARISLILLALMVFLYFFNVLSTANLAGSLGTGLLVILIFSFIPKIIKNGHI